MEQERERGREKTLSVARWFKVAVFLVLFWPQNKCRRDDNSDNNDNNSYDDDYDGADADDNSDNNSDDDINYDGLR